MADLVMEVKEASARRDGNRIVVKASGELANSRDSVEPQTDHRGDMADVYLNVKPAGGFGTEMTGPFSVQTTLEGAAEVQSVRVHARNGIKTVAVK